MSNSTGNNRVSALKRLSKPSPITGMGRRQVNESKTASVSDARELLANRNKSSFDARQLLSRKESDAAPGNTILRKTFVQTKPTTKTDDNEKLVVVTGIKDVKMKSGKLVGTPATDADQVEKKKQIFAVGSSTFVTIRNSSNSNTPVAQSSGTVTLTKTIKNPFATVDDSKPVSTNKTVSSSLSDQKVVIRFVNDKYQEDSPASQSQTKVSSSASSTYQQQPSPVIKRLHDASIQTASPVSSSRSPIRTSTHRRYTNTATEEDDRTAHEAMDDDVYEPPVKRTSSSTRKSTTTEKEQQSASTTIPTGSVKRSSTGVPISARISSHTSTTAKPLATTQSTSTPGTILVTNLQPSVTEDDVIELFGEIGPINQITTLSQGCVQVIYAKREHSEQAVAKYHNRLLDGQFMYVSLQQPSSYSTTPSSKTAAKDNGPSTSSSSTVEQPLKLNSSNSASNKIVIDPVFFRQALFNPSNNTANPVQFQVKL